MELSQELKALILKTLKNTKDIEDILSSIESKEMIGYLKLRSTFETELFKLEAYFKPPKLILDSGDVDLHNGITKVYNELYNAYNQFMELLILVLDKAEVHN